METRGPTTSTRRYVDLGAERAAHLLHRLLLRLLAARLLRDADQHVGRAAELLKLHVAEAERRPSSRASGEIGRSRLRLHLDQRAADEIDAEIQAVEEEQQHRRDRQNRRHREADAPEAHEVELGVVGDDAKKRNMHVSSFDQIGTVRGRHQRTHSATRRRVKVKAVNTVVTMPMPSVTAKPRTGPVPI